MFIRAGMNAFLDPTAGKLDNIAAEPLRVWHVTGSDEAVEAFRVAVGGVTLPDEDIVAVQDAEVVAVKVKQATEKVVACKKNLDEATTELADLQPVTIPAASADPVIES